MHAFSTADTFKKGKEIVLAQKHGEEKPYHQQQVGVVASRNKSKWWPATATLGRG
jgi:hypothetical protein